MLGMLSYQKIVNAIVVFTAILAFLSASNVFAGNNEVNFAYTDHPGHWLDTGSEVAGSRSIAIATPGVRINFSGNSNTVHTRISLIYPAGAAGMPFNTEPIICGLYTQRLYSCVGQQGDL
ncbi:hypothetical protein [Nitrosomonas sp. Nm33]|uniref:hypothetical protein n=1 Tax=Nitrosomonas sp. Nm33 TaxID=133724 RepID=UPI0008950FEA|nr:hypothetical protein [Nitrosomonas sp. Nm33]SDY81174.1 hypothetical protein SAMN05421755_10516 [Nitrosomonas sp. Nm33]